MLMLSSPRSLTNSLTAISFTVIALSAFNADASSAGTWVTNPDDTAAVILEKQSELQQKTQTKGRFYQQSLAATTVTVDPTKTYQRIEGYGAALTEASVINILRLPLAQQNELLKTLFDRETGAGLNIIRVPMGSSDLADGEKGEYTYDDSPNAMPDPELKNFSMARDAKTLRLIKRIKAINPEVKILINPWTAPAWMKDNRHFYGGAFESKNMVALARYFLRTIDVYHLYGLEVDYVGIQNEPGITIQYPSMYMSDDQQAEFIRVLGKMLADGGYKSRILANDDNYIAVDRVKGFVADPNTRKYIAAAGFHCWSNDPERVEELDPSIPRFETECGGNINSSGFWFDFNWWNKNRIIDGARRGLSAVITWNMVSDEKAGPHGAGPQGCRTCRGLVVVRPNESGYKIELNSEFAALAHASKFVRRDAVRINTEAENSALAPAGELSHTAFLNPDGKIVVLLNNWNSPAQRTYRIRIGEATVATGSLGPGQAATVVVADPR